MFKEIVGDLISLAESDKYDVIMHCHDCSGTFNRKIMSGLIEENYRISDDKWESLYNRGAIEKLGNITRKLVTNEHIVSGGLSTAIHNRFSVHTLYTTYSNYEGMKHYGCPFDYDALRICLRKSRYVIADMCKILMPALGTGSQGANWNIVRDIIKTELKNLDITVVFKSKEDANTK